MNLTRWDPFRDVLTLSDRMNRMLGETSFRVLTPACHDRYAALSRCRISMQTC